MVIPMDEPRITKVYVFGNGMVMVFDQNGQQMPDYQGRVEQVRDKIRSCYDGEFVAAAWSRRTHIT